MHVWQVLTDFENYPAWNPFIKKMTGKPAKDAKLEVHMLDPHGGTIVLTPTVLVSEKYLELRWLGKLEGEREFNGEHIFLIEPLGKTRFTLSTAKGSQVQWLHPLKNG
jgi:hypothetical protein